MIGIPVTIFRAGRPEQIYLSTRRSGVLGAKLESAKRQYRAFRLEASKLASRLGIVIARLEKTPDDVGNLGVDLKTFADEIDSLGDRLYKAREAGREAALRVVRLALEDNHGAAAEAILDELSDAQIESLVHTLETGETPKDFFPSRATPPNPSAISPSAASAGANSSKPDSPAPISKPGA